MAGPGICSRTPGYLSSEYLEEDNVDDSAWLWFAIHIALVFYQVTGVTQKLSTNRISSELSFLWFAYAMIAISAVLLVTVPMHWHVSNLVTFLAILGGTLNGLGR